MATRQGRVKGGRGMAGGEGRRRVVEGGERGERGEEVMREEEEEREREEGMEEEELVH